MNDRSVPNRELFKVLKAEGRVPWSWFASRALVTAVVTAYLLLCLSEQIRSLSSVLSGSADQVDPAELASATLGVFGQFVLVTCILSLVVVILLALWQTGFLLSPRVLTKRMGRRGSSPSRSFGVLGVPLGLFIGFWLFRVYLRDILLLLRQDGDRLVSSVAVVARGIGNRVIVVAVVLAILSWLASRLIFLWRNRAAAMELMGQR